MRRDGHVAHTGEWEMHTRIWWGKWRK